MDTPPRTAYLLLCLLLLCALFAAGAPVRAQEPVVQPAAPLAPDSQPALVPLSGIAAVSARVYHTCALTTAGGVKCWGNDSFGQVGDGADASDKLTPVDVVGLTSGVKAIAAGFYHTCALTTAGGVKCWGRDDDGQVGDGADNNNKLTPVNVVGLTSGVTAIAAGYYHSCALTAAGGVKCWGRDELGQVGDGADASTKLTPVDVVGLTSGVKAITAGSYHTCALTTTGGVQCWGNDLSGQVGDGADANPKLTPVNVVGLTSGVTAISAGTFHTCALTTPGGVKCWGEDGSGQVGDGFDASNKLTPVDVVGLTSGVTAISGGGLHTCARTTTGGVKCWGEDIAGQVGDGADASDKLTPADVVGLTSGVKAIAAGYFHTCALTTTGGVKCWGQNSDGRLGDSMTLDRSLPGDVLVQRTCFKLTRSKTGSGATPLPSSPSSAGCPNDHYLAGTALYLQAIPNAGQRVQSWSAPAAGAPGDPVAALTMPAADTTVTVAYAPCRTLTRSHTGSGGNPTASPSNSVGCSAGTYGAGESLVLVAVPAANQRVKAWSGAAAAPALGSQVNTLTMPDADKSVSVEYEACFTLSASLSGQGDPIAATPVASAGCLAGMYAAGESVTLTAAPANGWNVAGWSGTSNDGSTAPTNTVTMGAGDTTVGVTYAPVAGGDTYLYLPAARR